MIAVSRFLQTGEIGFWVSLTDLRLHRAGGQIRIVFFENPISYFLFVRLRTVKSIVTMPLKRKKIVLLLSALTALVSSCVNEGFNIGKDLVSVSTRTMVIDTVTLHMSTVLTDSVSTANSGVILVGDHTNPFFGNTKAYSYLTFNLPDNFSFPSTENYGRPKVYLDSLTLIVKDTTAFLGDTTQLQTIKICRLQEKVELVDLDNGASLYTTTSFRYDPVPIAVKSFYPQRFTGRALEIRLPDAIGQDFLKKIDALDDVFLNNETFVNYFKGLVLVPQGNVAISSFKADTSCILRLYYSNADNEKMNYDFRLNQSLHFNQVSFDRSASELKNLTASNPELPSSETRNASYIYSLAGIYTRIDIPYLNNLLQLGSFGRVISGILYIYPAYGSYGKENELPGELSLYVSDETNVVTGAITDSNGQMQTGYLSKDDFLKDTRYVFDLTAFLQDQLGKMGINKRHLQITVPRINSTTSTLVAGDMYHPSNNIKLVVKYSTYDDR